MDSSKISLILKKMQEIRLPVGATYLSSQLSIPPASIGRILAELEKEGLVEKVSNKGRVITEKGQQYLEQEEEARKKETNARELIHMISQNDRTVMLEVLETRKLLEGYTAGQACRLATDEEIDHLEGLIAEHMHAIRSGQLGNTLDLDIHLTIAKMARNSTICQILRLILTGGDTYTKFSFASDNSRSRQIRQHDEIIRAIRDRDPERASRAMEEHLDQVISDVNQYFESEKTENHQA